MYKLNGTQIESAPQNTGNISGFPLYLASLPISERQDLGWYSLVIEDVEVNEPIVDKENDCIRIPIPIPIVEEPRIFNISKLKLIETLESMKLDQYLLSYLNSDTNKMFKWNAAVVLASNNQLVLEACSLFKNQLGMTDEQINNLLVVCESDLN